MVVRESGALPSPRAVTEPSRVDWSQLPRHCIQYHGDLPPMTSGQRVRRFFMGQQEPRWVSPGMDPVQSGKEGIQRTHQDVVFSDSSLNRKAFQESPDKRCCLFDSARMNRGTGEDVLSRLAESEDCGGLATDSDVHFPPMQESRLASVQQEGSAAYPHRLTKTFAQVVSQLSSAGTEETQENCREETERSSAPDLPLGDDDSSAEPEFREKKHADADKADERYVRHLEFAIKCGYSEKDLEEVISRCGLDCDKNLLLQELVKYSSGAGHLEEKSSSEVTLDADPEARSQGGDSADMPAVLDDSRDHGEEVLKEEQAEDTDNLRHIIIDGSNVAMSHGKTVFSCRGIQIAVDWFRRRGHRNITVFVPRWRKETSRPDSPITDQDLLLRLEQEGVVVFTPARRVKGRRVVCYDDRYILRLAAHTQGVVVSNDHYRDLLPESDAFREVVENRLLMYTFVSDQFMPPDDPLGRKGPTLDNFLLKEPANDEASLGDCPYGRKCTYGVKCKYRHPERGPTPHKMVSELLKEQAARRLQERSAHHRAPEHRDTPSGGKPKPTHAQSAADREHAAGETGRWKPPSENVTGGRPKSPSNSAASKTSDYLREHREKLERDLASASLADPGRLSERLAAQQARESGCGSQVDECPAHPLVPPCLSPPPPPAASSIVDGHFLLASKLSNQAPESSFCSQPGWTRGQWTTTDEAPESSFCSQPGWTRGQWTRTDEAPESSFCSQPGWTRGQWAATASSFPGQGKQPGFSLPGNKRNNRRSSLSSYPHPHRVCSRASPVPQHTNTTHTRYRTRSLSESQNTGCPPSERRSPHGNLYTAPHPVLNTVGHARFTEPVPQTFYPADHFMSSAATLPSDQLASDGVDIQKQSLGPHLMSGAGDASAGHLRPPCLPASAELTSPDVPRIPPPSRPPGHRDPSQHRCQNPCPPDAPHTFLHPSCAQTGEGRFISPDPAAPGSSMGPPPPPTWGAGAVHHPHTFPSFPHPYSPSHLPPPPPPPPPVFQRVTGCEAPPWQLSSPPPVVPPAGPRFQSDGGHPVPASDPRYPLYLRLCDTFARHRVLAVMNKYPEVTDLNQLCVCILCEL